MSKRKRLKPSWEMTIAELEALTKDLDDEFVSDKFKPLTARERAEWESIKRGRGRPKVGKGVKVVSVSIERDLLARTDKAAKRAGVSRAKLVSAGLRRVLAELESGRAAATPKARTSKKAA
jgi:hypothetical protein